MKAFTRALVWVVTNVLYWVVAIYGMVYNIGWAFNTFAFFTVLFTLWSLLMVATKSALKEKGHAPSKCPVPVWLSRLSDCGMIALSAALGHFVLASLVVLQLLFQGAYYSEEKEKGAVNGNT